MTSTTTAEPLHVDPAAIDIADSVRGHVVARSARRVRVLNAQDVSR
jgi:hypothetical protein